MRTINLPLNNETVKSLKAGESVLLTGYVYTARDAAHKRLFEYLEKNISLPIELLNETIYYVGPTETKPGQIIGSAGPTTSSRMDKYTPQLIEKTGLKGMIGKGNRSSDVIDAIKKHICVYFAAIGGAGALLSEKIISSEIILFEDLGTEAIRKIFLSEFPATVAIDCHGNNLYEIGPAKFKIL